MWNLIKYHILPIWSGSTLFVQTCLSEYLVYFFFFFSWNLILWYLKRIFLLRRHSLDFHGVQNILNWKKGDWINFQVDGCCLPFQKDTDYFSREDFAVTESWTRSQREVFLNPCHAEWVKITISNFQPIRLLDPGCWYKFTFSMTNSVDLRVIYTVCVGRVYSGSAGPGLR